MLVSDKSRRWVRLQGLVFVVLFLAVIGLLGWLSTRYHVQADWTATGRNTLSEASTALLGKLDRPVQITAFAREDPMLRKPISELVGRYQRAKKDITLNFVNPDTAPDQVRAEGVTTDGELVIRYGERREHLRELSEQALTNALQRLARSGERWLVFIEGHGERDIAGQANFALGNFGQQLKNKGVKLGPVNLARDPKVPDNATALVIAGPQVDLLPGEVQLIRGYVERGGNLLWLADPGPLHGLAPLAEQLGVRFSAGIIVDPTTQLLGIGDPRFAVVAEYSDHPITRNFEAVALFPLAGAIEATAPQSWTATPFLRTVDRSWVETGAIEDSVSFDEGRDTAGPVTLGVTLTRSVKGEGDVEREQRVAVIADGDFLSNTYLGNGGNLDLGLNLINWLTADDQLIDIPAQTATDLKLELSAFEQGVIGIGSLVALPVLLLLAGVAIWLRRRRL